jgi:hypothetical protein
MAGSRAGRFLQESASLPAPVSSPCRFMLLTAPGWMSYGNGGGKYSAPIPNA